MFFFLIEALKKNEPKKKRRRKRFGRKKTGDSLFCIPCLFCPSPELVRGFQARREDATAHASSSSTPTPGGTFDKLVECHWKTKKKKIQKANDGKHERCGTMRKAKISAARPPSTRCVTRLRGTLRGARDPADTSPP